MKTSHALLAALSLSFTAGCQDVVRQKGWTTEEAQRSVAVPSSQDGETDETRGAAPVVVAPTEREQYVVHEWGTFTSLQGSDGRVQPGMHHEEESLPAFVYGRVPAGATAQKQVEPEFVDGVTQKLETPVIYFYGAPERVVVRVDFPRGVVSQWYPAASSFTPELHSTSFATSPFPGGSMTWSLDVLAVGEESGLVDVPSDDVWAPSRNVAAQPVRVGDEVEKFVFYRGLGQFETPFRVTSKNEVITLHNDSPEALDDVWVLQFDGSTGSVWPLGELGSRSSRDFTPTPKELPHRDYLARARSTLADGLIRSGLTEDEAWAMVDTWNRSYFQTPGLRVLYVAPRRWTDELLPLAVDPKPDELVRTLIGRVEVMTENDERALLAALESDGMGPGDVGRFAEPRLRRIHEMTEDALIRARIERLLIAIRSQD